MRFIAALRRVGAKTELKFPKDFKQCPICHCEETTVRAAYVNEPGSNKDKPTALETKVALLVDPMKAIGITAPAVIHFFDVCAGCGLLYCTRVEKRSIPFQVQPPPGKALRFPFSPS